MQLLTGYMLVSHSLISLPLTANSRLCGIKLVFVFALFSSHINMHFTLISNLIFS